MLKFISYSAEVVKFTIKDLAYNKEITAQPQHDGGLSQVNKNIDKLERKWEDELAFITIWFYSK